MKKKKKTRQARKRERKHDEKYQQASSTSITFTIASRPSHMHECMCPQCWSNHRESKPSSTLYFFNRWFTHLTKTSHACDWCYNGNSPYIHYLDRSALFIPIYESNQSHHNNGFMHRACFYDHQTILIICVLWHKERDREEKRKEKKMNRCSK